MDKKVLKREHFLINIKIAQAVMQALAHPLIPKHQNETNIFSTFCIFVSHGSQLRGKLKFWGMFLFQISQPTNISQKWFSTQNEPLGVRFQMRLTPTMVSVYF